MDIFSRVFMFQKFDKLYGVGIVYLCSIYISTNSLSKIFKNLGILSTYMNWPEAPCNLNARGVVRAATAPG